MVRYLICLVLLSLGLRLLAIAARLFHAAHRLGATAAPMMPQIDAAVAPVEIGEPGEPVPVRHEAMMTIEQIMRRTLH
jgi:hypothetical protein